MHLDEGGEMVSDRQGSRRRRQKRTVEGEERGCERSGKSGGGEVTLCWTSIPIAVAWDWPAYSCMQILQKREPIAAAALPMETGNSNGNGRGRRGSALRLWFWFLLPYLFTYTYTYIYLYIILSVCSCNFYIILYLFILIIHIHL